MQNHLITQELAQRILDYLSTRPYQEVHILIHLLQAIPKVDNPKSEGEKKENNG